MAELDDASGKRKASDLRTRSAILTTALIVGICLGVMASEKLYLMTQEGDMPESALQAVRSKKLEGVSGAGRRRMGLFERRSSNGAHKELEAVLKRVAPEGEVLIVISTIDLVRSTSLTMWIESVQRQPFKNWLVVAIDQELHDYCTEKGINVYHRPTEISTELKKTGMNHAVSAMKYKIIKEFLETGWNVLLSDADIVTVQNPFDHLYRDSDVEGMSDGFDEATAYGAIYGIDDASMGWSRYAQGFRHMALNSGLFYLRANERTIELMGRIAGRLDRDAGWDQSMYNLEIFTLSHGSYKSPQVSVRVMDYLAFMNSKTLFKNVRHQPVSQQPKPVMVHMNYHPDKEARMRAVIKRYFEGDEEALKSFPGGSEPGS